MLNTSVFVHNVTLYTITSCCITGLFDDIITAHSIGTVLYCTVLYKADLAIVCVCVFFPFILDIKFVGRTSRGHTGFLIHLLSAVRALILLARRIQPFLSLVDREVEFCVLTI